MKHRLGCQLIALALCGTSAAAQETLQQRVNSVHALIWSNYIQPEGGQLLTRLDMHGRPFYQPGLRESPSIEDCSLYGGMYLDAMLSRYTVTQKPGTAARTRVILRSLLKNATISPAKGLLARGTHPDGKTYWGEPSVDQYTGVIFGLWRYYRNPIATEEEKSEIRSVFGQFLRRLEKDAWTIRNEEGRPTRFGDLGALVPTRAERLLAFLLAGAEITGDAHWLEVYAKEKKVRLQLCESYTAKMGAPWVQVQNAMALRILLDLARDPKDREVFLRGAKSAADVCIPFLQGYKKIVRPDGSFMGRQEILDAGLWSESALTSALRNPFDAVTVVLLLERTEHYKQALEVYREIVQRLDFTQLRYSGFVFPGEYNYWLASTKRQFEYDPAIDSETREEAYRILGQDVYGRTGTTTLR